MNTAIKIVQMDIANAPSGQQLNCGTGTTRIGLGVGIYARMYRNPFLEKVG
jgi:hypothetical protein